MSCFESVAMQHDASDDVARSKVIDETYLYELIAASEFCIAAWFTADMANAGNG